MSEEDKMACTHWYELGKKETAKDILRDLLGFNYARNTEEQIIKLREKWGIVARGGEQG